MTMAAPTHLERLLRAMSTERAKQVMQSPELFHAQQTEVLLRGVSRGMDYLSTVPKLFTRRHWPHHDDAIAFVTAALCFYRWGQVSDERAFFRCFRLPATVPAFDGAWRRLQAIPRPTAIDVVRVLDLRELVPGEPGVQNTPIDDTPTEPEAC